MVVAGSSVFSCLTIKSNRLKTSIIQNYKNKKKLLATSPTYCGAGEDSITDSDSTSFLRNVPEQDKWFVLKKSIIMQNNLLVFVLGN